jgi:plastocyanin
MKVQFSAMAALTWVAIASLGASANGEFDVQGTVRTGSRPQTQAVVWLEASNQPTITKSTQAVLHQRGLAFAPQVLAVRVGTAVDFPNEDRVFHNVFSFRDGKKFDLGIYPVGSMKRVVFSQAGVSRLFCNIHPNMAGYVVAVDTPHFAVVDNDGRFTLTGVLAGRYTYHAWRPAGPILTGSVVLEPSTRLSLVWP